MKLLTSSSKILESLNRMEITNSFELIETLPYRYEDYSYSDEAEIKDKEKVTLLLRLVSNPVSVKTSKIDIIRFFAVSIKSNKFYTCVIFNRSFYKNMLNLEDFFTVQATFNASKKELNVINIFKGEVTTEKKYKPVYHLPSDLSQANFISLMKRTFDSPEMIFPYDVPKYFRDKYKLLKKVEALKKVHFPTSQDDIKVGLRTLKYGECLEFSLKNYLIKKENKKVVYGKNKIPDLKKINEFISNLSYKLTSDQIKAIREIVLDMNSSSLMYRLLEGDVGTGKTIVAITCLFANKLRGNQGAFMVPTDTLARQQYHDLTKLLSPYDIKVDLLIGSLSLKEKKDVKERIKSGEVDVIVGTHALFSSDVEYKSLGLTIIDEQHRFGVNQRSELVNKGDLCDLLLMSATPIPRTLAIAIYGDLDVSTLNEYPVSKNEVETLVLPFSDSRIFTSINEMLSLNRQIFIIAPKIEEKENVHSVESLYDYFKEIYNDEVLCLSSKNKSKDKEEILNKFKNKESRILISTTVVELGLNVLEAGLIIIYDASHFGLATLHQLRGRVGRDGKAATCLLLDDKEVERLTLMKTIHSGADLAYEDLKMRGSGDFLGVKQSGIPSFQTVNVIDDFKMFTCAREDASFMMNHLENIEFERFVLHVKDVMNKQEEEIVSIIEA